MYYQILPAAFGTILTSVLAHFWYSDHCFGIQWRNAGSTKQQQNDNSNGQIVEILARFVKCYCFILFYQFLNLNDITLSLQMILLIVGGIIVPNSLSGMAWEYKNSQYLLIESTEHIASLMLLSFCAHITSLLS